MRFRELESTPNLRQCVVDDVHVMYFRGPVDGRALDATIRASHELKRQFSGGIWAFNLAVPMLALPDREFQKKASEATRSVEGHLLGSVVVLPGEGFWVGAARAFVAGLMLLSPLRSQREFANDIPAGARALAKRSGRDEAWARELATAIAEWIKTPG